MKLVRVNFVKLSYSNNFDTCKGSEVIIFSTFKKALIGIAKLIITDSETAAYDITDCVMLEEFKMLSDHGFLPKTLWLGHEFDIPKNDEKLRAMIKNLTATQLKVLGEMGINFTINEGLQIWLSKSVNPIRKSRVFACEGTDVLSNWSKWYGYFLCFSKQCSLEN